ncbi:MAG: hypothetical protein Q4C49_02515 [Bacillota bacterium]|nr:hypothetical protein [Bacillota bacterium]
MKKILYAFLLSSLLCVGCANTTTDTNKKEIQEQETYISYLEHGDVLFKQKNYQKAVQNYLKAFEKDRTKSEVYAKLYKAYTELSDKKGCTEIENEAEKNLSEKEYKQFLEQIGKSKEDKPLEVTNLQFSKAVDQITVYENSVIDYNDYFEGKCAIEFSMIVNDSKVDFQKAGQYPLTVTLKDKKGNVLEKQAIVIVEQSPYEYVPGMYISNYRMNVRSEANVFSSVEGSFASQLQIVIDEIVKADDGSYWGVLSTGYVCIKDSQTEYLSFYRNRVPVSADFNNDNNTFIEQVCPAVNGLGGYRDASTFTGNVNRTMSCDDVFIVY